MKPPGERGLMLLPVVLALSIVGALAFTMTRDGSMGVAAVDAEYEIARVRYLAEAGVTLAKWQNEQEGCGRHERQPGAIAFPGGVVRIIDVDKADFGVRVDGTATLAAPGAGMAPAALALSRTVRMHDLNDEDTVRLGSGKDSGDTHIQPGAIPLFYGLSYIELTDGRSHGLIRFSIDDVPRGAIVTSAEFKLTLQSVKALGGARTLGVHRVTTDWDSRLVTWTWPWTAAGGDAAQPAVATSVVRSSGVHTWRIDALVEAWTNGTLPEYGLLLKPDGLNEARFASFNSSDSPELVVRYFPLCPK